MLRLFLITALGLAPTGPATAEAYNVAQKLTEIGSTYCAMSFTRDIGSFDSQPWLRDLVAMKYPQEKFCACVAEEFRTSGDDEMTAMMLNEIEEEGDYELLSSFLRYGFGSCMPEDGEGGLGIDLGLDDDDLNFTLFDAEGSGDETDAALADNQLVADEGDIQACIMAFDDGMLLPGFDPAATKARVRKAGQKLGDVCSCAGSYIAALGEPFQKEVEEASNPATIYGSSLAAGINLCIDG